MKEFIFKKIDAFATTKSDGNPAGYMCICDSYFLCSGYQAYEAN